VSTKWCSPPKKAIWSIFSAEVLRGITAMKRSPSIRAK
jgi:hypothetical protein